MGKNKPTVATAAPEEATASTETIAPADTTTDTPVTTPPADRPAMMRIQVGKPTTEKRDHFTVIVNTNKYKVKYDEQQVVPYCVYDALRNATEPYPHCYVDGATGQKKVEGRLRQRFNMNAVPA